MKKEPRIVLLALLALGAAASAGLSYQVRESEAALPFEQNVFSLVAMTLATGLFRRTL